MGKPTKTLVPRDDRITINHEFSSVDAFIAQYVTNISRSGVFIKTLRPLPVATRVNLKFTVIMDELETIEGLGEVVRVQQSPSGMGVVFVELTSHSQDLVAKLITRRRAGRPAEFAPITLTPKKPQSVKPDTARMRKSAVTPPAGVPATGRKPPSPPPARHAPITKTVGRALPAADKKPPPIPEDAAVHLKPKRERRDES